MSEPSIEPLAAALLLLELLLLGLEEDTDGLGDTELLLLTSLLFVGESHAAARMQRTTPNTPRKIHDLKNCMTHLAEQ